ncbi:MAG: hypothetical protein M3548_24275 [Actinomycetota bacterium]|nr:hypothetical protein [Actinomycetota bacterium]
MKRRSLALIAGLVSVASVLSPAGIASAAAGSASIAPGAVVFSDGFDSFNSAVWQKQTGVIGPAGKSQAYNLIENVGIQTGTLAINTRRHCVPTGGIPSMGNINSSGSGCPAGTSKRYSSGRVDGMWTTPPGVNFEARISALVPQNGKPGTRSALWMRNNQPYCDPNVGKTNLGEFDLLEWHPERPTTSDSTTHISCSGSSLDPDPWKTERDLNQGQFNQAVWHEWSVTRIGNVVRYYRDNVQIGNDHICGLGEFGFTQGRCDAVLNDPWHFILQGEVFVNAGFGGHPGPDPTAFFPTQTLLIDWVQVTTL